jgi:hypothetical protein
VLELTSRLARLFWEALDRADYAVTLVRCWAVDHVYGPEPLTAADKQREAEHGRLRQAFPMIGLDGPIGLQAKAVARLGNQLGCPASGPASNTSRPEVPAPRVID